MTHRRIADFIPFIAMVGYAMYQWITEYTPGIVIRTPSFIGLALLIITAVAFLFNNRYAVLIMLVTCLAGIFGIVSLSPALIRSGLSIGINLKFGDPVFFVLLVLVFVCSFPHLVGILTKTYWLQLFPQTTRHDGR